MNRLIVKAAAAGVLCLILAPHAYALGGRKPEVGIVSNVKVLSDKVEDVSSIDAWKKSFIKPGMTDAEKAMAIWRSVCMYRYQETPPKEFLQYETLVFDPIKTFNVYGYGMCCCASSNVASLARSVGLQARGKGISHHSISEIFHDGRWHMYDTSLVTYFIMPEGHVASFDELVKVHADYMKEHPDFKPKWATPLKKDWPAPFNTCPTVDDRGIFPARTHGLYSMWSCADGKNNFVYEYGYSSGYRLNIRLRPGEKLVRNWAHKGLHVNMDGKGGRPGCLDMKVGEKFLVYTPKFGDLANGRVGNGERVYDVPLTTGRYRQGAMAAENLRDTKSGIFSAAAGRPGVLVIRMPSSYVYLGGELTGRASVGRGGSIKIEMSRNNGQDWKEIASIAQPGEFSVDLKPLTYRLYDYRLRFKLDGADTGLFDLRIRQDIQHSQRALPALGAGKNTITFDATGASENTVTIEAATLPENDGNQLAYTEFHPVVEGCNAKRLKLDGGKGSVTFPVETPGDMKRLRFGCYYGVWGNGGWDLLVSFDGGATWKKAGRGEKNAAGGWGMCEYVSFEDVPKGTRKALVRYAGNGSVILGGFRIDADYIEPKGGFAPVKITYTWEEGGQPKTLTHVARKAEDSFTINCAVKPVMKSIVLEIAE